ncbi:MAG TPA: 2-C-methyl-D-erythritol 2,4-cyclodiphosphate synthase [Candidatus Hydrogenedentes bacterium]|nr:2-C-methyl-D-erythritol 2,4-cyclodiphosphate synthase [Candidatus Hydrogenedentota bacterium]
MRIGIGYDLHRLVEGRPLILGGVLIPFDRGLLGHSDADVLAHAIIDALLGAAGLGNIGQIFPDNDPKFKDADSMMLLRRTVEDLRDAGYTITNIDSVVVAERPRLNPHLAAIHAHLAETMGIDLSAVSVKPKTNEGVGPEGQGEAISAWATTLLERI